MRSLPLHTQLQVLLGGVSSRLDNAGLSLYLPPQPRRLPQSHDNQHQVHDHVRHDQPQFHPSAPPTGNSRPNYHHQQQYSSHYPSENIIGDNNRYNQQQQYNLYPADVNKYQNIYTTTATPSTAGRAHYSSQHQSL